MARFIADQRNGYRVQHAVSCALIGVSVGWFDKWARRAAAPDAAAGLHTERDLRRARTDRSVAAAYPVFPHAGSAGIGEPGHAQYEDGPHAVGRIDNTDYLGCGLARWSSASSP